MTPLISIPSIQVPDLEPAAMLGRLSTLLDRGLRAYRDYLSNGNTFKYARIIKDNNDQIHALLLSGAHRLPLEQNLNAQALIRHIDIWATAWVLHYEAINPLSETHFVFDNADTFPLEAVDSLISYYESLKV